MWRSTLESKGLSTKSTAPVLYPRSTASWVCAMADTKMIGVSRVRGLPRINRATSKPSIPGICTSSSTSPTSSSSRQRRASSPELAQRSSHSPSSSSACMASRFSTRSSTTSRTCLAGTAAFLLCAWAIVTPLSICPCTSHSCHQGSPSPGEGMVGIASQRSSSASSSSRLIGLAM